MSEDKELLALLRDAIDAGNRMSSALVNDKCTIPWDENIIPRFAKLMHDRSKVVDDPNRVDCLGNRY